MKTLIFLIIICSCVAMGQKIPMMTDSGNQWIKNHNFTTGHAIKSTPLTLEDWDEYVIECWKDSVIFTREWYERDMAGNFYKSQVDTMWTRKTKPTFEGFIEWSKERNKK